MMKVLIFILLPSRWMTGTGGPRTGLCEAKDLEVSAEKNNK